LISSRSLKPTATIRSLSPSWTTSFAPSDPPSVRTSFSASWKTLTLTTTGSSTLLSSPLSAAPALPTEMLQSFAMPLICTTRTRTAPSLQQSFRWWQNPNFLCCFSPIWFELGFLISDDNNGIYLIIVTDMTMGFWNWRRRRRRENVQNEEGRREGRKKWKPEVLLSFRASQISLRAKMELQVWKAESSWWFSGHLMPHMRHISNYMPHTQKILIMTKFKVINICMEENRRISKYRD